MASNPFSLEGKVALVTGANTGLGQGIALALAAAGADIAAAGIVPAQETGEKVAALGRRFLNIEANLISIERSSASSPKPSPASAGWTSWSTTPA